MRKFKKASVKLIASLIAVIILISPINVLAAVIAPKIDELLHGDEEPIRGRFSGTNQGTVL